MISHESFTIGPSNGCLDSLNMVRDSVFNMAGPPLSEGNMRCRNGYNVWLDMMQHCPRSSSVCDEIDGSWTVENGTGKRTEIPLAPMGNSFISMY